MAKNISLSAEARQEKEGKLQKVDKKDYLPAVLYGPGAKNRHLKIKKLDFEKIYKEAGVSNLVELKIDQDAPVKIIIKDVQRDVIKNNLTHADFYQIDMTKTITTEIPLHFTGESKAVKDLGLILVKNIDNLEVECLPGDLIDHINVDISSLNTQEDIIKISNLNIPTGLKVLHHNIDDIVANIVEQEIEETKVEAPAAEATAGGSENVEEKAGGKSEEKTPAAKK
ncbi:MAG: 50S ribosomal protein L25 [Patescibacteria group bacterium]|nr:50S ribosomal protein L25 [Patescibacteria group bacterium]MDD4611015.1 50S ribosomal protein L25 [Patescibacteria group bacterium]